MGGRGGAPQGYLLRGVGIAPTEGLLRAKALSVTCGDSSPKGRAKGVLLQKRER